MSQPNLHIIVRRMLAIACIFWISTSLSVHAARIEPQTNDSAYSVRQLDELVVDGKNGLSGKIGHVYVSASEINKTPTLLGERDLIKSIQSSAGVVSGAEGFAGLYVRGGENDQNLYLIDGLPLLNIYHFGGLFSTFSTHSIGSVDFYKGAFPSPFSERVSSIVDISLRKPDLYKSSGVFSIGLISGQLYFSTPLKRGSSALSVSLRRTWFDVLSVPALAVVNAINKSDGRKMIFNYNFTDLMLKFRAYAGSRNELNMLGFYGQDRFVLGEDRFDPNGEDDIFKKDRNKMSWGNLGLSAIYRYSSDAGILKIQPYATRAFASDLQENMVADGASQPISAYSKTAPSVLLLGIRESFDFPVGMPVKGSIGMQQSWSDYGIDASDHSRNALLGAYGELSWNIGNVFDGTAGLRANRYLSSDRKHWNIEPRLRLRFMLPREWNLSVSYSRMAQYAQQVSSSYIYLPSDAWLPTATKVSPLVSDIYSVGVFKTFGADCSIKGEVWWKSMRGLADFKSDESMLSVSDSPWYERLVFGRGLAYGLDIEAEGRYKSLHWSIAYGLMWNWRKFDGINEGRRFPAKFDNRNKIDIGVGWKISDRLELTGQWEYMTGNRTTIALYNIAPPDVAFPDAPFVNPLDPYGKRKDGLDLLGERNNVRLPPFHRLNINLSLTGRLRDKLTYQWDFGLYNAYSRMNPFAIVKNYNNLDWVSDGSYRKFKTLSLLPVIPSVSYTLYF